MWRSDQIFFHKQVRHQRQKKKEWVLHQLILKNKNNLWKIGHLMRMMLKDCNKVFCHYHKSQVLGPGEIKD